MRSVHRRFVAPRGDNEDIDLRHRNGIRGSHSCRRPESCGGEDEILGAEGPEVASSSPTEYADRDKAIVPGATTSTPVVDIYMFGTPFTVTCCLHASLPWTFQQRLPPLVAASILATIGPGIQPGGVLGWGIRVPVCVSFLNGLLQALGASP
jgi:hypothetical protein